MAGSQNHPEVDPIVMGQSFAPLNSTIPCLYVSWDWGTSDRNVITTGVAQKIVFDADKVVRGIRFKPSDVPTAPIFIKWHTAISTTTASATVFDEVLTPWDAAGIQLGVRDITTGYSIYSSTTQTVYTIEN